MNSKFLDCKDYEMMKLLGPENNSFFKNGIGVNSKRSFYRFFRNRKKRVGGNPMIMASRKCERSGGLAILKLNAFG